MSRELPEDITRALELLRHSENIDSHQERARLFRSGIDILNHCLNHFPQHEELIKDYKLSSVKTLLTTLNSARLAMATEEWFEYVNLLCITVKEEVRPVLESDPELRRYFLSFIGEGMLDVADE